MFRFTIRDVLWLTVVVACAGLRADEPGPTLKELIRQTSGESLPKTERWAAVQWAIGPHAGPKAGHQSDVLVVSWFRRDVGSMLRYTVSSTGQSHSRRTIFSYATQATHDSTLSDGQLKSLHSLLETLPVSKAQPPIERTVLISFQAGDKWRTETYDAAALPDAFEKIMLIIGERFETADRHKKR